ncbi:MAG: carboxynorspermidine decarboxylase [Bacteroidia bacterium]|nr:MAG: carboxynorspermidine decarboxylase [Bacteroidia bacterium]
MKLSLDFDITQIPTPCFVLDEKLLINNLEKLNYVQKEAGVKILCALKGFAMWSTFPLLRKYLSGATASSFHEAMLCYEEMQSLAHLCCPLYTDVDYDKMLEISSHITFNSLTQYERYHAKALEKGLKLAIRINPEYSDAPAALYNPCIPGSRLGVTRDKFGNQLPKEVTGLHFHSLCESDSYALENTLKAIITKFDDLLKQVQWFNMGGGHHITRKDYDIQHLIKVLKEFKARYPNIKEIFLEPGEAVGWQTGYLVSKIYDILENQGIYILMVDTSISAHMPDCIEMPYKPIILGATDYIHGTKRYRIGGMTCLAGDYVGDYSFAEEPQIGDYIVFNDMIHYTMVKTTTFNGINLPHIGIVRQDRSFHLVKSFGYQDYKSRLS